MLPTKLSDVISFPAQGAVSSIRSILDSQSRIALHLCLQAGNYLVGVAFNLMEAARRWRRDDAGILAACVAYYATVSLFPLLMVLISGLGMFLRFTHSGQDAEQYVLKAIAETTSYDVAIQVAAAFQEVQQQALLSGPLGIFGLLLAALAVFAQFDQALDRIWKIEPPPFQGYVVAAQREVSQRVKAFIVLVNLGLVVVLIFVTGICLATLRQYSADRFTLAEWMWRIPELALSIGLYTCVFTAIFRWLSKVPVDWLHAGRGGLLSAITWEVGRTILATFLIGGRYSAYGVVGSLLAAMLWAYYASSVLFLGAEYVQVIREKDEALASDEIEATQEWTTSETGVANRQFLDHGFDRWTTNLKDRRAA